MLQEKSLEENEEYSDTIKPSGTNQRRKMLKCKRRSSSERKQHELENIIQTTVDKYFVAPIMERKSDSDSLLWWKERKALYSDCILPELARKYLSAPPSSVFSERMFSQAGNIYTSKRNRLSPTLADQLLFLHHNLRAFDFKY